MLICIFAPMITSIFCTFVALTRDDHLQARQELQWGLGKHSHGAALGTKKFGFFSLNGAFWHTLYFWVMAAPPNVVSPRVTCSLTPPYRQS